MKALWIAAHDACSGQAVTKPTKPSAAAPTAACLAAKQAVKDAWRAMTRLRLKSLLSSLKRRVGSRLTGAFAFHHK